MTRTTHSFQPPTTSLQELTIYLSLKRTCPLLRTATIEPMTLSDRHPITITLTFPDINLFTKIWRLDSSLLMIDPDVHHISVYLQEFFWHKRHPRDFPDDPMGSTQMCSPGKIY